MKLEDIKEMVETLDEVSEITLTEYEGEITIVLLTALQELLNEYKNLKEENRNLKDKEIEEIYEYGN